MRSRNAAHEENVLRALESRNVMTIKTIDWPLTIMTYIAGVSTGALIAYVVVRIFPGYLG